MARAKTSGEETKAKNTEAKTDSKAKTKAKTVKKPEPKAETLKSDGIKETAETDVKAKPKTKTVKKPEPKSDGIKETAKTGVKEKPKAELAKPETSPNPPSSSKSSKQEYPYKVDAVLLQGLSIAGFKVLDKATGQTKNLNFTSFKARVEKGQIEGVKTVGYNGEEFYTGIDYKNLQVANMKADEKLLSLKTLKGLVVTENGSVLLI